MTIANITEYTIEQLEQESGTRIRTIRFYITEGLVDPPSMMGPYARYTDGHLLRLRVIDHLKKKLKLSEIKEILADRSVDLQAILAEAEIGKRTWDTPALMKLVNPLATTEEVPVPRNFSFATLGTSKPSIDIFSKLSHPPEPEHETWQRLRPVDGLEIHIRDDIDPQTRALAMQLIKQLRK